MIPVDHTTNKQVFKPSFQNRRVKSEHLKNSFPAGFKTVRSLPRLDHVPNVHDSSSFQSSTRPRTISHNKSYMSWAQGGGDNHYNNSVEFTDDFTSAHNSNVLSDPMAAMAGPYYSDMMRAKLNDASKFKNTYDPKAQICSIESHEIFLQERSAVDKLEEAKRFRAGHLTLHNKVYHAPTSMPSITSKLNNNKIQMSTPEYEAWLASIRTNNNEKVWHIKGNNEDYNYSAHNFKGEKAISPHKSTTRPTSPQPVDNSHPLFFDDEHTTGQNNNNLNSPNSRVMSPGGSRFLPQYSLSLASSSLVSDIPALILPKSITLEIYTQNQLVKSSTVLQSTQYIVKHVATPITLLDIKYLVIDEIILGIEKAFRLIDDPTSNNPSDNNNASMSSPSKSGAFDTRQIDLLFSYYNHDMQTWRELRSENDWMGAKMAVCCGVNSSAVLNVSTSIAESFNSQRGSVIKLMYSLEKSSEFILLKQIQGSYASRRHLLKSREAQVSLETLTRQLAYPAASSPTNNSAHKYKPLSGTVRPNLMATQQMQLQSTSSASITTHSGLQFNDSTPTSRVNTGKSNKSTGSVRKSLRHTNNSSPHNTNNTAATGTTVLQKSILYPRQSPLLVKLTEENRSLAEKQEQIAHILENKILKTKW